MSCYPLRIEVPKYLTRIKVSNSRKKKTFSKGDNIPKKYTNNPERYKWKNGKLYDVVEKTLVAKNSLTVGTPNYQNISGNEVYARMHERLRIQIVKGLKNYFGTYIKRSPSFLEFPITLKMELYTTPRYCDWDISNLWIYFKCFEDALKDEGYIPDDSIRYITASGGIEWVPVSNEEDRKMVFVVDKEQRQYVLDHVLYNEKSEPVQYNETDHQKENESFIKSIERPSYIITELSTNLSSNLGDIIIDEDHKTFSIYTKKNDKVVFGAVGDALTKIKWKCIALNIDLVITKQFYERYKNFIKTSLLKENIKIYLV